MKDTGDLVFSNGKTLENFLVVNKVGGSQGDREAVCELAEGRWELGMGEGNGDAWKMLPGQHHPSELQTWLVSWMSGAALGERQTSAGRSQPDAAGSWQHLAQEGLLTGSLLQGGS